MAESKNNIVTHGFSGKLGDIIVFRQKAGKTIVAKAAGSYNKVPTPAQQAVRERFQQAVIYGKSVLADATAKAAYEAAAGPGETAYNVAIADFFSAPDIQDIDVSAYTDAIGSTIKVRVADDFKVASVHVKIENADSTLVEQGNALLDTNGWVYTATVANASLSGDKITVTATDTPANASHFDKTLS